MSERGIDNVRIQFFAPSNDTILAGRCGPDECSLQQETAVKTPYHIIRPTKLKWWIIIEGVGGITL